MWSWLLACAAPPPEVPSGLRVIEVTDGWEVQWNGARWAGPADEVRTYGLLEDGTPHATLRRGDAWFQAVGARRSGPWEALGAVVGGGGRAAFQAKRRGRWHVVVDGDEGASWEWTSAPRMSREGHTAWVGAQDGRQVLLRDGRDLDVARALEIKAHDPGLAWAAHEPDGWRLYLDGAPLPGAWLEVGPVALGERWTFAARDRDGWWQVTPASRTPMDRPPTP